MISEKQHQKTDSFICIDAKFAFQIISKIILSWIIHNCNIINENSMFLITNYWKNKLAYHNTPKRMRLHIMLSNEML